MEIMELETASSKSVSLKSAMQKYDEKIEKDKSSASLFQMMQTLMQTIPPDAKTHIQEYVQQFNKEAQDISEKAEEYCTDIMTKSYDKGLFENYKSLNDITQVETEHTEYQADLYGKMYQVAASAASAAITGDIYTLAAVAYDAVDKATQPATKTKTEKPPKQDTKVMATQLYEYSNVLCSNTFWFHLDFDGENISLKGDRISYKSIQELFYILEENINHYSNFINKSNNDNKTVFESLKQKLEMLGYIIKSLEKNVNYNTFLQLDKRLRTNTENPILGITSFFDKQLNEIQENIVLMEKDFPVDEKEQHEKEKRNDQIRKLEEKNNAEIKKQNQFKSDQLISDAIATQQIMKAWVRVKVIDNLKLYGGIGTSTLFALPRSIIGEATGEIMGTMTDVLYKITSSPGGMFLLLAFLLGSMTVIFTQAGLLVRASKSVFYLFSAPFVFVYKVIKTPFGYMFAHKGTILDTKGELTPANILTQTQKKTESPDSFSKTRKKTPPLSSKVEEISMAETKPLPPPSQPPPPPLETKPLPPPLRPPPPPPPKKTETKKSPETKKKSMSFLEEIKNRSTLLKTVQKHESPKTKKNVQTSELAKAIDKRRPFIKKESKSKSPDSDSEWLGGKRTRHNKTQRRH
jgi:outer membrane biosynthesis protein TonB